MPNNGLINSLNRIRELSSEIYHQYIPIITEDTDISALGNPVLTVPAVQNEFMSQLINRIVYTQFEVKYFRNPLQILEGDRIPLGYIGQEIYVAPQKGRQFNVDDFAGLLQKYEANVKVQYLSVNSDLQYPVTVSRHKLKQAFTSWDNLNSFIDQISNSLYNGAYIDEFKLTKDLVASAYQYNKAPIKVINAITTEEQAKAFVTDARSLFLNFQAPSSQYNSWKLLGDGSPLVTWTNPEDIVFIIRNDVRAYLDVNVLANAFNIDKSTLLGNIISVDNFNVYNDDGTLHFDGSNILGIMCDKAWFKIKRQDMFLDEFYNANNRTWQYYLNITKMYNFSLFANAMIYATAMPNVPVTKLDYNNTTQINLTVGEKEELEINVTPLNGTTAITYSLANSTYAKLTTFNNDDRHIVVEGIAEGSVVLTAKAGSVQTTLTINVSNA